MPKPQRTIEENEAIRQEMLDHAVELIAESGYKGFSMRKLAARLGIAAKTIYNYFHNKDEIYLAILTKGFATLHEKCRNAGAGISDPFDRIEVMCRAYMDFGLTHANLYNLMFTWHVPKFKDYVGTRMEPAAQVELETALMLAALFVDTISECADDSDPISEADARFLMIEFWSQAHGYIAGINNTLLDYMHEAPLTLRERIIARMMAHFRRAFNKMQIPAEPVIIEKV